MADTEKSETEQDTRNQENDIDSEQEGSEQEGTESETNTEGEGEGTETVVDPAEVEALRKKNQKLEQELNMRRNEADKAKKEAEKARLKAMEEQGEFKELAETLQEKLDRIENEKAEAAERAEAETFREKVIATRRPEVQKIAKALLEKNPSAFAWGEVESWEEAEKQVNDQLDAIESSLGLEPAKNDEEDDEDTEVHSNNPNTKIEGDDFSKLSVEEMRKVLPRGDAR